MARSLASVSARSACFSLRSSSRFARACEAVPLSAGTRVSLTSAFWITEPNFSRPALGTVTMTLIGSLPEE